MTAAMSAKENKNRDHLLNCRQSVWWGLGKENCPQNFGSLASIARYLGVMKM